MGFASVSGPRGGTPLRLADLDIVPQALLTPPDIPIRSGWRTDAGVVLDRELVALAGMETRGRLVQARIARRLIDRRGWRSLGFVRLADYARERLGISPRSVEDDARIVRALEALPRLRAALEAGSIGWTKTRLLVRVATAENETHLLERAAALPTRELENFVRALARDGNAETSAPAGGASTAGISGQSTPPSEAPASISRESATATSSNDGFETDDPEIRWSVTVSRSGRRMWQSAREFASRSAGSVLSPAQVLELVAAEAMSGAADVATDRDAPAAANALPRLQPSMDDHSRRLRAAIRAREQRGRSYLLAFLAEVGVVEGFGWLDPGRFDPGPAACLDALTDGLDGADAFELDRRFQQVRAAMQRIDYQMAALLRIGIDRRLFREIGFATVKLYVESRLGCSARNTWSLVAIERESWRSTHLLREAWREGKISHLAAVALLPIISETHGEAWIRRAGEVTLRRLHDEVAWALDHGQAPSCDRAAPPPLGADIRIDRSGDVTREEVQMRAHGDPGDTSLGPPGASRIDVFAPVSVAALVETAIDRLRRDREPRWRTFERMVALALIEWTAAPRHRDPVFERDGWRCSVPGCSSRRNLHDHHVLYRSHGGGNARDNRTTVCAAHHLHGIHGGIVRARGRAPHEIVWELGCAAGRRPLMRLLGDRILAG